VVAEKFHQLPSVVARELDVDSSDLNVRACTYLRYAEAKAAWDRVHKGGGSEKDLESWKGDWAMEAVEDNVFARHKARFRK
jgi:hypothetical protein